MGDLGSIKDRVFISGDSWAVSPALYAYSYSLVMNKTSRGNIRVVSVGDLKQRSEKIPENIGFTEWVRRFHSLQGPSKLYSQEFLLDQVLREAA
jgi:hypothetical protein